MSARNSAAARAAALRAGARRGPRRRAMSLLGVRTAAMRQADAQAAQWEHGAKGEEATKRLLRPMTRWAWFRRLLRLPVWVVRHDLRLRGRRFNLDHVLVSPCGTAVVVLDTKAWRRTWPTTLSYGRVHCGPDDRHGQVEKVASYAAVVAAAAGLHPLAVRPLIVVHGSPVAGGHLEAPTPHGPVHVLSPGYLVPTLTNAPAAPDVRRARALAEHVGRVLSPYVDRG